MEKELAKSKALEVKSGRNELEYANRMLIMQYIYKWNKSLN